MVALAQYFFSLPTWNGGTCKVAADDDLGFIDPRTMFVINLGFGSMPILFGVMITLMAISARGFVAILTGVVMPYGAAYFLSDNHLIKPLLTPAGQDLPLTVARTQP